MVFPNLGDAFFSEMLLTRYIWDLVAAGRGLGHMNFSEGFDNEYLIEHQKTEKLYHLYAFSSLNNIKRKELEIDGLQCARWPDEPDGEHLWCMNCSVRRFWRLSSYKVHCTNSHSVAKFPCNHCKRTFGSQLVLEVHVKAKHTDLNTIMVLCLCGQQMTLAEHRGRHASKCQKYKEEMEMLKNA